MKFIFSFEKVLQHKRDVEDAARRDLNGATAKLNVAEEELASMYRVVDESRKRTVDLAKGALDQTGSPALRHLSPGGFQVHSLMQIDDFIRGQGVRIDMQKYKVREHKAIVEEAQEVLLEAAKERKIYEKLRERRLEEFKAEEKKRELKRVDDMIVTRFKIKEG